MVDPEQRADLVSAALGAAEDVPPGEAVEAVVRDLGASLDATDVSFLMVDLSGRGLVRHAHPGAGPRHAAGRSDAADDDPTVLVLGHSSSEEDALRTQQMQVLPPGSPRLVGLAPGWLVLAPVTERGDVLGLLAVSAVSEPDAAVLTRIRRTAHALAYVVVANRRHTDRFEWTQRSESFTLPAEIQWRLLPASLTCEAGTFTLSAWLEPAAEVGGDTFDYSVERDVLHLSVTDAMGHGVASALIATLCVGSLRNSRRSGASLLEQLHAANGALVQQSLSTTGEGFATGLFGRVDLRTGVLTMVNAGHATPYLARGGTVTPIDLPVDLPLGMFSDATYRTTEVALEPGDRLVLVTDGMLERRAATIDLPVEIAATRALHPREATRFLADEVLEVTGPELEDDATLLVVDWHGRRDGSLTVRHSVAGAEPDRASPPAD